MNTNYQPVQRQERVEILDLLRGFALLGIFMVNMPLMNAPFLTEMAEFSLWTDPVNEKAGWIIDFFFTGKFYTLFSMLFGIGFYFFMKKADESGNSVLGLFKRRLGWLLAIGVLHVILLWYGDILVFYALFGFLMILFRKKSNKSLIIWAVCVLMLPLLFSSVLVLLIKFALTVPEVAQEMQAGFEASSIHMNQLFDHIIEVYTTGSFTEIIKIRLQEYQNILGGIFFFYPNVLAMFLVGMVLARRKVFEDLAANRLFFKKMLFYSLPVALVANWMYAYYSAQSSYINFDWPLVLSLTGFAFGGPSMTFVYISLIVFCYQKGYFKILSKAIQKTGRMALTNYLMQSVIATTIFFSYGLGLYGQVDIVQGMMLVTGIYVVQVIWSHFWLKYYRFGPMEWLWRTLTYGKKQKMKL